MIEFVEKQSDVRLTRAEYDDLAEYKSKYMLLSELVIRCTKKSNYYDSGLQMDDDRFFYNAIAVIDGELFSVIKAEIEKKEAEKNKDGADN